MPDDAGRIVSAVKSVIGAILSLVLATSAISSAIASDWDDQSQKSTGAAEDFYRSEADAFSEVVALGDDEAVGVADDASNISGNADAAIAMDMSDIITEVDPGITESVSSLQSALIGTSKRVVDISAQQDCYMKSCKFLALLDDGTVMTWSGNSAPQEVSGLGGASISRLQQGTADFILTDDGHVLYLPSLSVSIPAPETGTLIQLTVVGGGPYPRLFGLLADGSIVYWGSVISNNLRQTQPPDQWGVPRNAMTKLFGGATASVAQIAGGTDQLLLRLEDGSVRGVGSMYCYVSAQPCATALKGALVGKTATDISAGWAVAAATLDDGTAAVWGWDGKEDSLYYTNPIQLLNDSGEVLGNVNSISSTEYSVLVHLNDGSVFSSAVPNRAARSVFPSSHDVLKVVGSPVLVKPNEPRGLYLIRWFWAFCWVVDGYSLG